MCIGIQLISVCELCHAHTPVDEIQWLGCHLELSEGESYPLCPEPTIINEFKRCDCRICLTEADDGHDPNDIYPEPPQHPGFPLSKPQIDLSQAPLPAPTNYQTTQDVENLAGPANELPSYIDAMNDSSSPDYALIRVRDERLHASVITYRVHSVTAGRHRALVSVATRRRQEINYFRNRITNLEDISIANLLNVADKIINDFLSEQEETVTRVTALQEQLLSIERQINFEGPHPPSPSEMALLEHQRQSIIRELEEKYIQNFMIPTAEQWDSRLQSLQDRILERYHAYHRALESRFAEMRLLAHRGSEESNNTTSENDP